MSYNLLKGKKGIIFGALDPNSIAWKTAERVHEEGGEFVLTNAPIAMRMGQINDLAEKTGSQIIPADATSEEDLQNLVEKSMEILGGKIDFVLHSPTYQLNAKQNQFFRLKSPLILRSDSPNLRYLSHQLELFHYLSSQRGY